MKVRTTLMLQVATGVLLVCGLLATTIRLPVSAWGAEPRVLTQSRLPSTISKRLSKLPMGPITSWFRALTLWDPDMKFFTLFDSNWSIEERDLKFLDLQNEIVLLYNITDEEEKIKGTKKAEENYGKWRDSSDAWREYVKKMEQENKNLIHPLLPDPSNVEVESDMVLSIPMKTSSGMKSWMVLESLRTLRVWPGEVILSTGLRPDLKETDYPILMTMLFIFHHYYSKIVPPTSSLKFIIHTYDGGPWSSRYTGIKMSSAPLITLIDNDDYLSPLSIKIRSQLLKEFPDLDYMLGGFTSVAVKHNKSRMEVFKEELFPNTITTYMNQTADDILQNIRPHVNYQTFESTFHEFNFTRRNTFYLGSIVSLPNVGTQWYRMHEEPFIDVMERNRQRISNLTKENRLPQLGFEQYLTSNDKGAFRGFLENRERQDKEYLLREIERANDQDWDKRCHNAWSAGRREVYETISPPIWQWNGEDSAFNFMVYGARFNAMCVGAQFGGYGWWDDIESMFRKDPIVIETTASPTTPKPKDEDEINNEQALKERLKRRKEKNNTEETKNNEKSSDK